MESQQNDEDKNPDLKSDGEAQFYSDTLKKHFFDPKNLVKSETPDFEWNGVGEVGSPACGDVMRFWVQIDPDSEKIKKCGWKTFGCGSAIASTSVLSEMIKGMPIKKALQIKPQDIKEKLGGMPKVKVHCSVLGDRALESAINDYFVNTDQYERVTKKEETIVDPETETTQKEIKEAAKEGLTFEELQEKTKVGVGDKEVKEKARKIFQHYRKEN